jgi:hypothetical protein
MMDSGVWPGCGGHGNLLMGCRLCYGKRRLSARLLIGFSCYFVSLRSGIIGSGSSGVFIG